MLFNWSRLGSILICFALILYSSKSFAQQKVSTIVRNGTIYTMDASFSKASVMVVDKGKILAIGGNDLLLRFSSDDIIDAKGQFLYPGFIDAHCHFTGYGMDRYKLELYGSRSFEEILLKLKEYSKTYNGTWLEGRSWDNTLWENKEMPSKEKLDELFPDRPVLLMRIDGHVVLCNQKALDIAGIHASTKIEGGSVELINGKPSGILHDAAIAEVQKHISSLSYEDALEGLKITEEECFALGLTSLVDCWVKNNHLKHVLQAYKANELSIRTSMVLANENENYDDYLNQAPLKTDKLHIIGFKIFADGALGSRGAYLKQCYHDKDNHFGSLLLSLDSIDRICRKVYQSPYQMVVHAIGDHANSEILNIYAKYLKPHNERRWRIEHAQVVSEEDIPLFKKYNIIPSVQPTHAISDMAWAQDRLGSKRVKNAYAYQDLLRQNKWLPLGTDFPVEGMNPLHTFCAAVFRKNAKGEPTSGFQFENALSRVDALKGITIWAAMSAFDETNRGSLEKGKWADFVMLPIDLLKADMITIYNTPVTATYLSGKLVYSSVN